jgi:acetoin utilization protein AcuB
MFVSDWMTKKVFTVSPDTSIADAAQLIKEKEIKHLPVLKKDKVKGILSDSDIKESIPSRMGSLDLLELHSHFAGTKVKEAMKTDIIFTAPDVPIEEAAMIMYDNNIGCLPVMEKGRLAGIISDRDIFRVLIDISGVRHCGHRVSLSVEDRPGALNEVSSIIRKHGFSLQSTLTSYERVQKGHRNVVIRLKGAGNFSAMKAEFDSNYLGVRIKKG